MSGAHAPERGISCNRADKKGLTRGLPDQATNTAAMAGMETEAVSLEGWRKWEGIKMILPEIAKNSDLSKLGSDLVVKENGECTIYDKPVVFVTSEAAFAALQSSEEVVPVMTSSLEQQCRQGYTAKYIMMSLGLKPPVNPYHSRTRQ
jgi:hypothetical protein